MMLSFNEFKALCNIQPRSLREVGEIYRSLEKFVQDHPELKAQIDAYMTKLLNHNFPKYGKALEV